MRASHSPFVQNLHKGVQTGILDAILYTIDKCFILMIAGGALVAIVSVAMRRERWSHAAAGIVATSDLLVPR